MASTEEHTILREDLEADLEPMLCEIESSTEVQELIKTKAKKPKTPTEPLILLTSGHVLATVNELIGCSIISDQVKLCLRNVPVEKLWQSLQWLNSCLVKKRLMMSAAVDKVWKSFQKGVQEQLEEMCKVTSSKQASAILALHVMKKLVNANYRKPKETPAQKSTVTPRDVEIITYITGFLLRRYRQLPEAQALRTSEATGFTAAIDRGGLIKPKLECVHIVLELEEVFRGLPTKSVDRAAYEKILSEHDVPKKLFGLLEEVDTTPEQKEDFYYKITTLFFTLRAHQKCRHFLEQHILKTHSVRKSKALRDSI